MSNFAEACKTWAKPFESVRDLKPLVEKVKDKKVVMIGEASHGTSDFYRWRADVTLELIENHGFEFVGIEGDYPDSVRIRKFLESQSEEPASEVLRKNQRWPAWMWANVETASFLEQAKEKGLKGFYGLDLYSFYDSIIKVVSYLKSHHPAASQIAEEYFSCFHQLGVDGLEYARQLSQYPRGCLKEIEEVLSFLKAQKFSPDLDNLFDAKMNARVVKNAENYYRTMVLGREDSWNVRDRHMMEVLNFFLQKHKKGIVWAHNTHVGDYRATSMKENNLVNLGGLAREQLGKNNVSLIGFGTFKGKVIASDRWEGEVNELPVPEAIPGSIEAQMHKTCKKQDWSQFSLDFSENPPLPKDFFKKRGHRAIGVVYHPFPESPYQYVPTVLPQRYDHFLFINETSALCPLRAYDTDKKLPEAFPTGL